MEDLVGELADEKQTASIHSLDAIGTGGIGYDRGIEPFALVLHTNLDDRFVHLNGDVDAFGGIEFVAVHDGIRQSFTEGHSHLEPRRARRDTARHTVARNEIYGFFDDVQIGGHPKANLDTALHWFGHPHLSAPNEQPERSGNDLRIQRSLPPLTAGSQTVCRAW